MSAKKPANPYEELAARLLSVSCASAFMSNHRLSLSRHVVIQLLHDRIPGCVYTLCNILIYININICKGP